MDDLQLLDVVYRAATRRDALPACLEVLAAELAATTAGARISSRGAQLDSVAVSRDSVPQPRLSGPGVSATPLPARGATALSARFAHGAALELELEITRPATAATFTATERVRFHLLGEHLARALALYQRLVRLDDERRVALAGLEMLEVGVALVDADGHLQHANRLAHDVFASVDGLVVHEGRVRCADPRADRALAARIAAACSGRGAAGGLLRVERVSSAAAYGVRVANPEGALFELGATARKRVASLYITDPARRIELPPAALAARFGFSPAQARVVSALIAGDAVEDIARALGVQANTVRAHLKAVFRLTGTRSQAALVGHVLQAAPWLAIAAAGQG
ncbi:MAG: hypothetical protein H6977_07045 [Gammaproteobacteria bacterium]|nr:hypothetical protein [Gammaproteobacteria bacterium]